MVLIFNSLPFQPLELKKKIIIIKLNAVWFWTCAELHKVKLKCIYIENIWKLLCYDLNLVASGWLKSYAFMMNANVSMVNITSHLPRMLHALCVDWNIFKLGWTCIESKKKRVCSSYLYMSRGGGIMFWWTTMWWRGMARGMKSGAAVWLQNYIIQYRVWMMRVVIFNVCKPGQLHRRVQKCGKGKGSLNTYYMLVYDAAASVTYEDIKYLNDYWIK